ncbi:MAG: HEAT repeat domain-containing protein, partial [Planctomycetes bacterium]|nr:HEAT repeat domain-containing protein [Planctomycetota bacterium]
ESGAQGYRWGMAFRPDPERAVSPANPEQVRLRMLDELGRFGDRTMVPKIRSALADESPAIRIATMRAMMRLGVVGAEPDLFRTLNDTASTAKERAWAARALSRSPEAKTVVPELIRALDAPSAKSDAGERAAIVESLRKLTGLSMGARPQTLFTSITGEPSQDAESYAQQWQDWWSSNQGSGPDDWLNSALSSEIAKDRASAARLLGGKGDINSLPLLIKALEREVGEEGKSGVREAISKALEKLSGIKTQYIPYIGKGESEEAWNEQHDQALKLWKQFDQAVRVEKKNPYELKLANESPSTRAAALREIKYEQRDDVTLQVLVARLEDSSTQVAQSAWGALVRITGVGFPLDFTASAAMQRIQIERWKEWAKDFEQESEAMRILSIFRNVNDMRWGLSAAANNQPLEDEAKAELAKRIISMRSRALAHIARHQIAVPPDVLIHLFREQISACKDLLDRRTTGLEGVHTMLQRNLVLALAPTNDDRLPSLLIERLRIAADSRRMGVQAGTLDDLDVVKACIHGLGEIGNLPSAAT